MADQKHIEALLELGWSYRRIEPETGIRRETVARYDPGIIQNRPTWPPARKQNRPK